MTTFICEVSSNHARDLGRALRFIDTAAEAGFDAVKFQLFKIDQMFAPEVLAVSEMHRRRRAWELPTDYLAPLAARCAEKGVAFACTPFYLAAVEELEPHVAFYKIASYELLWDDLLRAVAATGKPVILSTGMATEGEVLRAVGVLTEADAASVELMHCVSAYPTPRAEANLRAIETLREKTGLPVGWSDHTVDPGVVARAAGHWRASSVEMHFDLEGEGAEFAAGHCWLPRDCARLIAAVKSGTRLMEAKQAAVADGSGVKAPVPAELADRDWRADPTDGLRPLKHIRQGWAAA